MKFDIWIFFEDLWRQFNFLLKYDKNNGYFMHGLMYFLIIARSFLLRMRNISDKLCREKQNTHFMFNVLFPENRVAYEITRKHSVDPTTPQMTIRTWRMRFSCSVHKATKTHRSYVTHCFSVATVVVRTLLSVTLLCIASLGISIFCVSSVSLLKTKRLKWGKQLKNL